MNRNWASPKASAVAEEDRIRNAVITRFDEVALDGPAGRFSYPVGLDGLAALRYPMDLCSALPQKLCARFCGVGNVQIPAALAEGEHVLDIGCGCGTDSLLAALSVGEQGRVTGIDLSPAMIRKARRFAEAAHIGHAEFIAGDITAQTFPPEHFDAVLSNGVFNLIPDKEAALRQIYTLLKRGGRLVIADQVRNAFTSSPLPANDADAPSPASWAQWRDGTVPGMVFLAMLEKTGFIKARCCERSGFASSPQTTAWTFIAVKP